ncbi:hypothetical protein CY34DRAFT_102439, partial [Suillus luteus UH-Slu-Lm8-n1]
VGKAAFRLSPSMTHTLLYPQRMSRLMKYRVPLSLWTSSWMREEDTKSNRRARK